MESSLDVGYSYEHVIQTFLSTSAACLLPVLANSVQTYFMVITSYNWWRFFLVTVVSLVLNQTWIALYMMVTYVTPSNACHAGLVIAILAGFSGGFIVTRDQFKILNFKCPVGIICMSWTKYLYFQLWKLVHGVKQRFCTQEKLVGKWDILNLNSTEGFRLLLFLKNSISC